MLALPVGLHLLQVGDALTTVLALRSANVAEGNPVARWQIVGGNAWLAWRYRGGTDA